MLTAQQARPLFYNNPHKSIAALGAAHNICYAQMKGLLLDGGVSRQEITKRTPSSLPPLPLLKELDDPFDAHCGHCSVGLFDSFENWKKSGVETHFCFHVSVEGICPDCHGKRRLK